MKDRTLIRRFQYLRQALRIIFHLPPMQLFAYRQGQHSGLWLLWNCFRMWDDAHVAQKKGLSTKHWGETVKGDSST